MHFDTSHIVNSASGLLNSAFEVVPELYIQSQVKYLNIFIKFDYSSSNFIFCLSCQWNLTVHSGSLFDYVRDNILSTFILNAEN